MGFSGSSKSSWWLWLKQLFSVNKNCRFCSTKLNHTPDGKPFQYEEEVWWWHKHNNFPHHLEGLNWDILQIQRVLSFILKSPLMAMSSVEPPEVRWLCRACTCPSNTSFTCIARMPFSCTWPHLRIMAPRGFTSETADQARLAREQNRGCRCWL